MLANDGELEGVRILNPETVKMIYTEGAYRHLEMEPGMEWGLGMIVRKDPKKAGINVTKDTYGWSGAYGTHFFVSPKDKLEVVFVMNRANIGGAGSHISKRIEELVFE
jgi:CubicO group peptidase (beta-lactamase class C family)